MAAVASVVNVFLLHDHKVCESVTVCVSVCTRGWCGVSWRSGVLREALKHGVRLVPPATSTAEEVLLGVGKKVKHDGISYASRMSKALVVFSKEQSCKQSAGEGVDSPSQTPEPESGLCDL